VRQASSAITRRAAGRRNGRAGGGSRRCLGGEEVDDDVAALRLAPRHEERHRGAGGRPESSKSPTIVMPIRLRPIRLTQVISVTAVSSTPARMAQSLASVWSVRKAVVVGVAARA
jgi:hypothetical protein